MCSTGERAFLLMRFPKLYESVSTKASRACHADEFAKRYRTRPRGGLLQRSIQAGCESVRKGSCRSPSHGRPSVADPFLVNISLVASVRLQVGDVLDGLLP